MCRVNLNQELNGIEIKFDSKPDEATIEAIKKNGFRWNRAKKIWYAKQTAEHITFAESLATIEEAAPAEAKPEIINLDNLGVAPMAGYGSDLAKQIREDLKKRGVKGCTVRARRVTYETGITVTVKATEADFVSIEEACERYPFYKFEDKAVYHGIFNGEKWIYRDEYQKMTAEEREAAYYKHIEHEIKKFNSFEGRYTWSTRENYWMITTAFYKKLDSIFKIANQWNWDKSDSQSDYFDIGYFLDIDVKQPEEMTTRATMTEAEKEAYKAEQAQKEAEEAEAMRKYEAEQEERRKAAEEAEKWRIESEEIILNDISIIDLDESEQLYISGLIGGIGKECNLEELKEEAATNPHPAEALITRKVIFNTEDALNRFNNMYMHDFVFVAGKGGTATEDSRVNDTETFYKLNDNQREEVFFYNNDCIAVYYNDILQIVINPEGFSYSRYVYIPTDETKTTEAAGKLEELRTATADKEPFYFPEAVTVQKDNLKIGEAITVYQCDGWILNNVYAGAGTILNVSEGNYAQYTGIYIDLQTGRQTKQVFIRDNHDCLIYKGIKNRLPEEVTAERINDHMTRLYNYDELIPNIYNYYKSTGEEPILNTWQH